MNEGVFWRRRLGAENYRLLLLWANPDPSWPVILDGGGTRMVRAIAKGLVWWDPKGWRSRAPEELTEELWWIHEKRDLRRRLGAFVASVMRRKRDRQKRELAQLSADACQRITDMRQAGLSDASALLDGPDAWYVRVAEDSQVGLTRDEKTGQHVVWVKPWWRATVRRFGTHRIGDDVVLDVQPAISQRGYPGRLVTVLSRTQAGPKVHDYAVYRTEQGWVRYHEVMQQPRKEKPVKQKEPTARQHRYRPGWKEIRLRVPRELHDVIQAMGAKYSQRAGFKISMSLVIARMLAEALCPAVVEDVKRATMGLPPKEGTCQNQESASSVEPPRTKGGPANGVGGTSETTATSAPIASPPGELASTAETP